MASPDDTTFPTWFLPFFFIGLWLVVTTITFVLSGWPWLARRYPDRDEPTLLKIGSQSGMMGLAVSMNGILVLSACPSGLRVAIWRIFGPFCRPFFVPWGEISVRPTKALFIPRARLGFGQPEVGALSISQRTWDRLVQSAPDHPGSPIAQSLPPVSEGGLVRAYVLQWLAITALAACFFYFAPRQMAAHGPYIPPAVCIGFPATVFGVSQVIRYLRDQ